MIKIAPYSNYLRTIRQDYEQGFVSLPKAAGRYLQAFIPGFSPCTPHLRTKGFAPIRRLGSAWFTLAEMGVSPRFQLPAVMVISTIGAGMLSFTLVRFTQRAALFARLIQRVSDPTAVKAITLAVPAAGALAVFGLGAVTCGNLALVHQYPNPVTGALKKPTIQFFIGTIATVVVTLPSAVASVAAMRNIPILARQIAKIHRPWVKALVNHGVPSLAACATAATMLAITLTASMTAHIMSYDERRKILNQSCESQLPKRTQLGRYPDAHFSNRFDAQTYCDYVNQNTWTQYTICADTDDWKVQQVVRR